MLKMLGRFVGSHLLKANNWRTQCPPGDLRASSTDKRLPKIIVATTMRSGTHLIIDMILNNFAPYRQHPLYVDIDRLLKAPSAFHQQLLILEQMGTKIIKTHMPQTPCTEERMAWLERMLPGSLVITTWREPTEQAASLARFGASTNASRQALIDRINIFHEYWDRHTSEQIAFSDLLSPDGYDAAVTTTASMLGIPRAGSDQVIRPPGIHQRGRIYFDKTCTRLLGKWAPRINTGIGFRL